MFRLFLTLITAFTLVGASALEATDTAPKKVGLVVSLKGKATIIRKDGTKVPAKLRTAVFVGDKVETAFKSKIQIDFLDRSKLSLAGSTDAEINDYFYDGKQKPRSELTVRNGAVRFMAGKIAKMAPENYKIHTATATIGIRGSSGEFVTSDGKLPGVQKGLQLMKTGGIGITAQPTGSVAPPVVITNSGAGLVVNPKGAVQKVQFSGSLVKHYSKTTEQKVASGRDKAGAAEEKSEKQESAKAGPNEGGEKDESTAEAGHDDQQEQDDKAPEEKEEHAAGPDEGGEEESQPVADEQQDEGGDKKDGKKPGDRRRGRQPMAQRGHEDGEGPVAEMEGEEHDPDGSGGPGGPMAAMEGGEGPDDKPPMDQSASLEPGAPPPTMHDGDGMMDPMMHDGEGMMDPMMDGQEPMKYEGDGMMEPMMYEGDGMMDPMMHDGEGMVYEGDGMMDPMMYDDGGMLAGPVMAEPMEPIPLPTMDYTAELSGSIDSVISTQNLYVEDVYLDTFTAQYDAAQETQTAETQPLANPMPGLLLRFGAGGGTTSSLMDSIIADNDPSMDGVIVTLQNTQETLSLPGQANIDWENATTLPNPQILVSGDPSGEFYLVNAIKRDAAGDELNLMVMGEQTPTTAIPGSGVVFYGSDVGLDPGTSTESLPMVGSTLVSNGQIANEGLSMYAAADFSNRKIAGVTVELDRFDHDFDPNYTDPNYTGTTDPNFDGMEFDHGPMDHMETPYTMFYGDIDAGGNIQNVSFFANSGFMPSHLNLSENQGEPTPTYELQVNHLEALQGGGQFYGSQFQGLAIQASDANSQFLGAGFQEADEDLLPSVSGSYVALGQGLHASGTNFTTFNHVQFSSGTINPTFETNNVEGNIVLSDGRTLYIGPRQFALDREIVFGELMESSTQEPLISNSAFIAAMELPEMGWDDTLQQEILPEDVMWGTWNLVEGTDAGGATGVYPGLHNFWVAGKATTPVAGANLQQKLQTPHSVVRYHGMSVNSIFDGDGLLKVEGMHDDGDALLEMFSPEDGQFTPGSSPSGAHVDTLGGLVAMKVDYVNELVVGIGYLPSGTLVLMKSTSADMSETGFTGNVTLYSLNGQTNRSSDFFNASYTGTNSVSGQFVGSNAQTIIYDYNRQSTDPDHFGYGVGVASGMALETSDAQQFYGTGHGVLVDWSANGATSLLDQPNISVSITGDDDTANFTSSLSLRGGTTVLNQVTDTLNTWVDRNAYFTQLGTTSAAFDESMTAISLDPNNTYIVGMPGLEEFEHLTWGMWGGTSTDGMTTAFGYYAGGRESLGGVASQIPDFSALAAQANPVVTYRGVAMGHIFDGSNMEFHHGGAAFDVNFNTGAISGGLNLGDTQFDMQGTINASTATFSGSAGFNGAAANGAFSGGFYSDQMAGSFQAQDGTRNAVGAFGAQAEAQIPMVQRPQ